MKKEKILRVMSLLQPWADKVVVGELPILIRSFGTGLRCRIGIYATYSLDRAYRHIIIKRLLNFGMIIGSVKIKNCIKTRRDKALEKMREIGGKDIVKEYPRHWIPDANPLYLWEFSEQKKWVSPKKLHQRIGRAWTIVELEDE